MSTLNREAKNILILDADHIFGKTLATVLSEAGHAVSMHARRYSEGIDLISDEISEFLSIYNDSHGPFDHIIFGLRSNYSESADSSESIRFLENELSTTLNELKACAQLLMRRDESQLWVLLQEDSMQYYMPLQSQPIRSRALIAAVKCLAKEVFCFGIKLNVLQIQPLEDQFDAAVWKGAKDHLKAYAIKFKPQNSFDVAQVFRALLEVPRIPLSGMVIPIGVGFPEANI